MLELVKGLFLRKILFLKFKFTSELFFDCMSISKFKIFSFVEPIVGLEKVKSLIFSETGCHPCTVLVKSGSVSVVNIVVQSSVLSTFLYNVLASYPAPIAPNLYVTLYLYATVPS